MVPSIQFDQRDCVGYVSLSHPRRFNAMSRQMWRELRDVFECLQFDNTLRCVVLSGQGGNFCAGGDISEYPSFRFSETSLREFHEGEVWGGLQAMLQCDLPIVAQIAGNCMGAGLEIASCCDIRLAAESAHFGAPIARLGFPMAPREAALVLREVGSVTVRQMLLEAAVFGAADMLQRGFLSRVVVDAELANLTQTTVQRISQLGPEAARLNKQTLRTLSTTLALDGGLLPDEKAIASKVNSLLSGAYAYASRAEQREGIAAFLEKRAPAF